MGLFSKIKKTVKKVAKISTSKYAPINIGTLTKAGKQLIQKRPKQAVKTVARGVTMSGVIGGAVAGSVISPQVPLAIAKSVIPKTLRGKVLGASATLIGAGILAESKKARSYVTTEVPQIPEKLFSYGGDVGEVIEGDKEFTKEDIIEGLLKAGLLGGVITGGIVGAGAVKGLLDKDKPPKNGEKPIGIEGQPILPERTKLTPTRKPSKRRRIKKTPSVRQSVRINVINKPKNIGISVTNKKYLSQELLN